MSWLVTLRRSGLPAEIAADRLTVQWEGQAHTFEIVRRSRAPRPSEIGEPPSDAALIWVPALVESTARALEARGWSWGTDQQKVSLRMPGGVVIRLPAHSEADSVSRDRGEPKETSRVPAAALAVLRVLLEHPTHLVQHEIARLASITQPRVSQVLHTLSGDGLTNRSKGGWRITEFDRALDWWLASYQGPGGMLTRWYGLAALDSQATAAANAASGDRVAVSGDAAADVLAPWRRPTRVVVYADRSADLEHAGLVPTDGDEATLWLVMPRDRSVYVASDSMQRAISDRIAPWPVAAISQVLWDVHQLGASDSEEAASVLRQAWKRAREEESW